MTDEEKDYTEYATKPATPLQERFAPWLLEKTGYNPATAKTKADAFADGVRLSVFLRIPFQASPENRQATEILRQQRAEEAEAARAAREEEKATRAKLREEEAAAREAAKEEAAAAKAAKSAAKTPAPVEQAQAQTPAAAKPVKAAGRARGATKARTPAPF